MQFERKMDVCPVNINFQPFGKRLGGREKDAKASALY